MRIRNVLLLALAALAAGVPIRASAQIITVNPSTISQCTQLVSGDREFGGHGPQTSVQLNLKLASNPTVFYVDLHMDQVETGGDRTTGVVNWQNIPLATSPGATHFTHIWEPDGSGGFHWVGIGPGVFWNTGLAYTDTNWSVDVFNNWDWWIQSLQVTGDTKGTDITCQVGKSGINVNYNKLFLFAQ
jgi:hypothetical protein